MAEVRPIDANALMEQLRRKLKSGKTSAYLSNREQGWDEAIKSVMSMVHNQHSTLDYAPARHAEWKLFSEKPRSIMVHERVVCSECKRDCPRFTGIWFNFCPYCGAKMDGGKSDD